VQLGFFDVGGGRLEGFAGVFNLFVDEINGSDHRVNLDVIDMELLALYLKIKGYFK
jgi:hypothetical protein